MAQDRPMDQTVPGGVYRNAHNDGYHNAHGDKVDAEGTLLQKATEAVDAEPPEGAEGAAEPEPDKAAASPRRRR